MAEIDEDTKIAVPNRMFTNIGKLVANEGYLDTGKHLVDVAGGLAATLPSYQDFSNN